MATLPFRLTAVMILAVPVVVACMGHPDHLASLTGCRSPSAAATPTAKGSLVFLAGDGVPFEAPLRNIAAALKIPVPTSLHATNAGLAAVAVAPGTHYVAGLYMVRHHRAARRHRIAVWGGKLYAPLVIWRGGGTGALSWSPTGRALYFGGLTHLLEAKVRGTGHIRLRPLPGGRGLTSPAVSPDGRQIAAIRRVNSGPTPAYGVVVRLSPLAWCNSDL